MIQLRWLNQNGNRILQWREYTDHAVYALPAGVPKPQGHEDMRWTAWRDVPEVTEPTPTHDPNKCPKCGLDLKGSISYTCIQPSCPTGLGGSFL